MLLGSYTNGRGGCLQTRSGPTGSVFPLGREGVVGRVRKRRRNTVVDELATHYSGASSFSQLASTGDAAADEIRQTVRLGLPRLVHDSLSCVLLLLGHGRLHERRDGVGPSLKLEAVSVVIHYSHRWRRPDSSVGVKILLWTPDVRGACDSQVARELTALFPREIICNLVVRLLGFLPLALGLLLGQRFSCGGWVLPTLRDLGFGQLPSTSGL